MIKTKVKAMTGNLLKDEVYITLIENGENFINLLATHETYEYLQGRKFSMKNRHALEEAIWESYERDTKKLFRFMPVKKQQTYENRFMASTKNKRLKNLSQEEIDFKNVVTVFNWLMFSQLKNNIFDIPEILPNGKMDVFNLIDEGSLDTHIKEKYNVDAKELEEIKEIYLKKLYKKAAIYHNGIYNVIYYLYLKEIEIANLIKIIEGLYYRESKENIQKRLIL